MPENVDGFFSQKSLRSNAINPRLLHLLAESALTDLSIWKYTKKIGCHEGLVGQTTYMNTSNILSSEIAVFLTKD